MERIDFFRDEEKMRDYYKLSKDEFLASYSYLTEAEYEATEQREKDIMATIKVVQDILETEEFNLQVSEFSIGGYGEMILFHIKNFEGLSNLGDIENEAFDRLNLVIDRLDNYHNDYFHEADCDKQYDKFGNEIIDEKCRPYLMFLESDFCSELLSEITPSVYCEYVKETAFDYHKGAEKFDNFKKDALTYLLNKDIAQKIIETQSAYVMLEYNDKVYLSYYGYGDELKNIKSKSAKIQKAFNDLVVKDFAGNDFFTVYDNYKGVIDAELTQILDDINDLGLHKHYLSRYEFEYLGLDKSSKYKDAMDYEHRFDDCVKTVQADNLPTDWKWVQNNDGSGHLQSPEGTSYFSYDWTTGEYKVTDDKSYDFFMNENYSSGGYSIGSFSEFKKYAENYIKENVLNIDKVQTEPDICD